MKDLAKRKLLITIAAALIVLMLPAMMAAMGVRTPGIEEAHAGDAIDIDDVITGTNTDGTVDPGATLSVSLSDLDAKKAGIKDLYEQGKLDIYWSIGEFGNEKKAKTDYSGGVFSTKVTLKDAGKNIWLDIDIKNGFDDTGYNLNSSPLKIYDGTITINYGPSLSSTYYRAVTGLLSRTYEFSTDGQTLSYTCQASGKTYYSNDFTVRLLNADTNAVIKTTTLSSTKAIFKNVKLPYNKAKKFKVQLLFYYGTDGNVGGTISFTENAVKLGKNKVYATKISSKQAIVRWNGVSGASGYYIYQGGKRIKKVGKSKRKITITRKGAGKAKFKVIPYVKVSGSVKKGTSNKAKPKANYFKTGRSTYYKNYEYAKGQFILTKASAKGKNYTFTCYAINNRIFKLVKYKKITIKVWADGKLVAKKTLKNKKVNVKESASKKVVIKTRGKVGDLRNGNNVTYSISYTPIWEHGYTAW